ncbi:hydrophobic/amphiphilic exporter-1, HAE1 family [Georgenia satyanarayanai]|uniref:Hydrophobic/amphiphilic exporter-1, HAE1 family n=1 Tax=Georgenia satyanarayanai TaxID=860221 RepID=A0A2Y9BWI4_9MICO|nr:efflux RND transporter permease subunit [Georgenia satyanarayanai]PYG00883.1 HAE1 family hydrophobic/amphiphilic exporter-1 [Georgenia satyanarayanai]SSA39122.1 hydrophobic/amphiphilic exporter-1, HAE1 family [Georgenia satyanarayanai]
MSSLARFSLANRALVALATVLAVLGGLWATTTLKQELIPPLDLPVVGAVTTYPGASPEVVEQQVSDVVEQAAGVVAGLEGTTSTSSAGSSVVLLELAYGTDVTNAQQELQAAITRLEPVLPESADTQVVSGGIDDLPVVQLAAATSGDQERAAEVLRTVVVPELERLEGVRDVQLSGVQDPLVRIDVDLAALAGAGVDPSAIADTLRANGAVVPGGTITEDDRTLSVETGTRLTSAEEIAALPIATESGPVAVGDVAEVSAERAEATSFNRTDGDPSFGLAVTKTPDGNTVDVSQEVQDLLGEFETALGDGAEITVVFDQAPFIQDSIKDLATEGLLGLVFAVVVILLFLRTWRPTGVTALSIPLSLIVALIGLRTVGYTLNLFTLAALTVSVGRVVDDSIVVIENINRHLSYGKDRRTAILDAVREVAGAITSATIATAAVFVPIGLVGGMVGELFRPFAFTAALALLASLFVALTIVPVLAYWFVRGPRPGEDAAAVREAAEAKERSGALQRTYVRTLRTALARPWVAVLLAVAVLGGTVGLATQLETEFIGDTGQNTLSVTQALPPGTSLEAADAAAQEVEAVVAELDAVDTYQVTGGAGDSAMAFFGAGGETTFSITLDLDADAVAAEDELRSRLAELDTAGELTVATGMAGFSGSLEVVVSGADGEAVESAAADVLAAVEGIDGTTDVASNLAAELPTLLVEVDRDAAAALGLSEAQVGQTVSTALQGTTVASINTEDGRSDVVMDVGQTPTTREELQALPLTTALGPVPLSEVAEVREVEQPVSITRADGLRSATISATSTASDLGTVTSELQAAVDSLDLPDGVVAEVAGVSAEQEEAFANLGLALALSIAIVYLVMVATFNSLVQPLILLVSVPFAATGAVGMLVVTGSQLDVPGLIGALMLVGVVVTNAIVLIDLINQYRKQAMGLDEAIVEGGRHRLAPILMTAAATIAALVPMAIGITGGSAFVSQPLALVVIGGLITSTFLTLLLVPVLYLLVERRLEKQRARRAEKQPDLVESAGA